MLITGYLLSILMGAVLGTLGAGGSILILPILVYFMDINPSLATTYSLVIVGFTALIGSIKYLKNNQINLIDSLTFAIPSLITIYLTRRYLLTIFPDRFYLGDLIITKDFIIMMVFCLLMSIAAYLMLFSKEKLSIISSTVIYKNFKIIIQGSLVGLFTGIVGAGGGFLIIPTLVIFAGMNIKIAIGTSLFIIFIKSIIGFIGDMQTGVELNYYLIIMILTFTTLGILLGSKYSKNISSNFLKKAFGFFLIIVSIVIILKEIIRNNII